MDTTDEWIQERTGIEERRYADRKSQTTSGIGALAAKVAIKRAGITVDDIDFIIFATLSPDYNFPGSGVILQRELGITGSEIGALDIRNQCSGFIYALSIADQFIRTGTYKNILVVGAEIHSYGLDFSTRGRNVTVIFGDGAGAVIMQPTTEENKGILTTKLHSDGSYAEKLSLLMPGSHIGVHLPEMIDDGLIFPHMEGQFVFKLAVTKFPEVIGEALEDAGLSTSDIDLLIPHQANLRISQFVQKKMGLSDDKV
ncbi:UNVERIFIED_CONTAM: hypothetical protein GTU68_020384, partial [Idotea baltica]|nr:hypothetical protein [Idotea baltica]